MTFADAETGYLASQRLGRLATIGPTAARRSTRSASATTPQLGTIDVTGFTMATSQKSATSAATARPRSSST